MTTTTTGFCFQAIAFFFLFISSALGGEVVELTSEMFRKQVGQDRHTLVEFYTPRCGNCELLAPEYENLAEQFKREKSVLIAKVDCNQRINLCKRYDLNGYPTIRWFPKGSMEPEEYTGKPTAESMAEFVNARTGTEVKIIAPPSTVVVLTADDFNKVVLDETKDVLVEFYIPWCARCEALAPIYEKLARAFKLEEDVVIASINAGRYREMIEKYAISEFPALKFFPKSNKAGEDYSGALELSHLVTFINDNSGTNRDQNGKLTAKAGIIQSLDNLVKKFISASDEEKKMVYSLMVEEVDKLTDSSARHGKIYLKAAKSSMDKGLDYAKNEMERISRIASSETISDAKSDEFALKKNILSTFA